MSGLLSLPNELLLHILSFFATKPLLLLATISERFHDIVLRIIHKRLLLAASLKEHKLILECYHPASKNTEPYLFCDYLGTPGLSSEIEGEGWAYNNGNHMGRLGRLGSLYSRFRPIQPELEHRVFRSHPAGDVPGHPGTSTMFPAPQSSTEHKAEALVSHSVHLDSHELFSQLCVVANLVQLGPRRGVFYSFVNIADGVVRIWRDWLSQRADETRKLTEYSSGNLSKHAERIDHNVSSAIGTSIGSTQIQARTLWVDDRRNVGVRVRVKERKWGRDAPILLHRDEDPAMTYAMEYEELQIRTNHLLLAVERTLAEQNNVSGKAMIFGSFPVRTNS